MKHEAELFSPQFAVDQRKVRVAIAATCNLHCSYCDQGLIRTNSRMGAMEDFRSTNMHEGVIPVQEYLRSLEALRESGYNGVTFTGGEPLLNPHWPELVSRSKEIDFENVRLTTNGLLLSTYIRKNGKLPDALDLLTVSLDTFDDAEFHRVTGGHVTKVLEGLELVMHTNPELPIKANKVVMRSNLSNISDYLVLCDKHPAINQLTLLNLVCKDPLDEKEREFFSDEFVPPAEIMETLADLGLAFTVDSKHEYVTTTDSGLIINLMDTTQTLRSAICESCPIYCQEGLFTTRIATDGTIRSCGDFHNRLPYFRSTELGDAALRLSIRELLSSTSQEAVLSDTLAGFCEQYDLQPVRTK